MFWSLQKILFAKVPKGGNATSNAGGSNSPSIGADSAGLSLLYSNGSSKSPAASLNSNFMVGNSTNLAGNSTILSSRLEKQASSSSVITSSADDRSQFLNNGSGGNITNSTNLTKGSLFARSATISSNNYWMFPSKGCTSSTIKSWIIVTILYRRKLAGRYCDHTCMRRESASHQRLLLQEIDSREGYF